MNNDNPFNELKKEILTGVEKLLKEKPDPQEEILTREKTCEILNVCKATLRKWTKDGKIQAYGAGDRVYYKRSEILKALQPINLKKVA